MNCSSPQPYYQFVSKLKNALQKRAYPSEILEEPPYDPDRRNDLIKNLQHRETKKRKLSDDKILFKCFNSTPLQGVRIKKEVYQLLTSLRRELGAQYFKDPNVVIALYRKDRTSFCERIMQISKDKGRDTVNTKTRTITKTIVIFHHDGSGFLF